MALDLEHLLAQLHSEDKTKLPPVYLWQPEHIGEIDIHIDAESQWFHEGGRFERLSLVKLLSSILRLDEGEYYLVTPAEKLKITVDDVPFSIVSFVEDGGRYVLVTNTEELIPLDSNTVWELREYQQQLIPYVELRNGLYARVGRHVFYQLIDLAQQIESEHGTEVAISSDGCQFSLGSFDDE